MGIRRAISLLGPTASGKSCLALALAKQFSQMVIVNADSQQVYRGMVIGTGAPSEAEKGEAPHHLYTYLDPNFELNLGTYLAHVEDLLSQLPEDTVPVFVGGAGFYHRGLWQGLPDLPKDTKMREILRLEWAEKGGEWLYRELQAADPVASGSIHPSNRVRVLRALEVIRLTGKPFSAYKETQQPISPLRGTQWLKIGLDFPRSELYRRINDRVEAMVAAGLFEEVEALDRRWGRAWALTRCLGYKESLAFWDEKLSREACITLIQQNTRHYAKRQLTWFRHEPEIEWGTPEAHMNRIKQWL